MHKYDNANVFQEGQKNKDYVVCLEKLRNLNAGQYLATFCTRVFMDDSLNSALKLPGFKDS